MRKYCSFSKGRLDRTVILKIFPQIFRGRVSTEALIPHEFQQEAQLDVSQKAADQPGEPA